MGDEKKRRTPRRAGKEVRKRDGVSEQPRKTSLGCFDEGNQSLGSLMLWRGTGGGEEGEGGIPNVAFPSAACKEEHSNI